jgi:deazaflavin-dependent oxidoreductase (nitroreductase family)
VISWLTPHADEECCDVTTIGRRSGQPHEIEIWFGVIDDTMYLISGNGPTADWYRNALNDSQVSVRLAGQTHEGVARAVTDADERRRVGDLMGAKYPWDVDRLDPPGLVLRGAGLGDRPVGPLMSRFTRWRRPVLQR